MKKLPRYSKCFVCGRNNRAGLDATFAVTEKGVECNYITQEKHNGYEGIIHGGIITALLDECIGWAVAVAAGTMCVTGELTVRFKKPLPVGAHVTIKGVCPPDTMKSKRYFSGQGKILGKDGTIYAEAKGKFFPMPDNAQKPVLDYLENADDPGKPVRAEDIWG